MQQTLVPQERLSKGVQKQSSVALSRQSAPPPTPQQKRRRQRQYQLEQLIQTEKNYIQTLRTINQKIKTPCIGLIGEQQAKKLFDVSNLLLLNNDLLQAIKTGAHSQTLGANILVLIDFFKIYLEFLTNYGANQERIRQLMLRNKQFRLFVQKNNYSSDWKKLDLFGLYSQPFQRPGKYTLFLRDILKCTQQTNPDYKNIQLAMNKFKSVLSSVDSSLNKILGDQRLAELQLEYGDIINNFSRESRREFISQKKLRLILNGKQQDCKVFFFNDLLLIDPLTKKKHQIIRLPIDQNFCFNSLEDGKTFKNVIKVSGQQSSLSLVYGDGDINSKQKAQAIQLLTLLASSRSKKRIQVQVMGSDQLDSKSLDKHTVYIIQFRYGKAKQIIFKRFSQLQLLEKSLAQKFPTLIQQRLKKDWFNSYTSKTIQLRKLAIEGFLHLVFSNQPIFMEEQGQIQKMLGINCNLLQKLSNLDKLSKSIQQVIPRSMKQIFQSCYLRAGRLGWFFQSQKKLQQPEKLAIDLPNRVRCQFQIDSSSKIIDLMHEIKRTLSLQSMYQYRLIFRANRRQSRIIDIDQFAWPYLQILKRQEKKGYLNLDQFKSLVFKYQLPRIMFIKVFFLTPQLEDQCLLADFNKLKLLRSQIFNDLRIKKWDIDTDKYCVSTAIYSYLRCAQSDSQIIECRKQDLQQVMPEELIDSVGTDKLLKECTNLLNQMTQSQRVKRDPVLALSFALLNCLRQYRYFGSNFYFVQLHHKTQELFVQYDIATPRNMWLVISLYSISLLTPTDKKLILEVKYEDIKTLQNFSNSISMRTPRINGDIVLRTEQPFQISSLMRLYSEISMILKTTAST